jgi:hypothetical protein
MNRFIITLLLEIGMLISCYAYTQQPLQQKDDVNTTDAATLENKGWKDLPSHQEQYDRVVRHVRSASSNVGYFQELNPLLSRLNGGDLLTQAVWKGVISGDLKDTTLLLHLFDRIAAAPEPLDLPARSRLWNKKSTMLIGLGRVLWRLIKHDDLPIAEMQQIELNPQKWRAAFATAIPVSGPLPVISPASTHEESVAPESPQTNPSVHPSVKPVELPATSQQRLPIDTLETKPTVPSPIREPTSSTPWSIIVVLIVAAIGLLWLACSRTGSDRHLQRREGNKRTRTKRTKRTKGQENKGTDDMKARSW